MSESWPDGSLSPWPSTTASRSDAALSPRSRESSAGCRHAGHGRLSVCRAPSRRAETCHSPHRHGHGRHGTRPQSVTGPSRAARRLYFEASHWALLPRPRIDTLFAKCRRSGARSRNGLSQVNTALVEANTGTPLWVVTPDGPTSGGVRMPVPGTQPRRRAQRWKHRWNERCGRSRAAGAPARTLSPSGRRHFRRPAAQNSRTAAEDPSELHRSSS